MSRGMKTISLTAFVISIVGVASLWAFWTADGVPICTEDHDQGGPVSTSDSAGGAIVAWGDRRTGGYSDIYAQRVNASGAYQWATDGIAICASAYTQINPAIVSDGSGGAIIGWRDERSGERDIYAQRVNASGAVQWAANGIAVCTATGSQEDPKIISDGAGGAIITWADYRSGNWDIYAQRVHASGAVLWTADGVAVTCATGSQYNAEITSDGAGGAIVTWADNRSGNWDIYAQRVNASGTVQWTADGIVVTCATGSQNNARIASDGAGGAIIAWEDSRNGGSDIYAQRVNASGSIGKSDLAICINAGACNPLVDSDGAGGAIFIWEDVRTLMNTKIYAQRLVASKTLWIPNGIPVCSSAGNQYAPALIPDGSGGAIVAWQDSRGDGYDIYAQRVDALGTMLWAADGVALCTATGDQGVPTIVTDGESGAIAAWEDRRSETYYDIYAIRVSEHGYPGNNSPHIESVSDVPADQGGFVRLTINRSPLDDMLESTYPIWIYNIWQRIDDPALLASVAGEGDGGAMSTGTSGTEQQGSAEVSNVSCWPLKEWNGRRFIQSKATIEAMAFPPGIWELLGSFAACQQDQYIYRASTLADSTTSGTPYSVYMVSAHTTTLSLWFMSHPDSAFSVDNLPPEAPGGLVAEQSYAPVGLELVWGINQENDLSHYAVYRGSSEDFVPSLENRVATPTAPEWFDGSWRWDGGYYYKVSAIDVHGNESGFALLAPEGITGTDTPKAPGASYLAQNYPNPFNPTTRIAFGLKEPAAVSLRIYDAAGRLVRALVEGERPAGTYSELWDGRDSNGRSVASGIYFYRLSAGTFEQTKKMALMR
jgi:hypothetical protein